MNSTKKQSPLAQVLDESGLNQHRADPTEDLARAAEKKGVASTYLGDPEAAARETSATATIRWLMPIVKKNADRGRRVIEGSRKGGRADRELTEDQKKIISKAYELAGAHFDPRTLCSRVAKALDRSLEGTRMKNRADQVRRVLKKHTHLLD